MSATEIRAQEIEMDKDSRIKGTIICGTINIEKGGEVEDVFADNVNIEKDTDCGTIECNVINVEKYSDIKEIRYVKTAKISPNANVGRVTKIEKLSRNVPN